MKKLFVILMIISMGVVSYSQDAYVTLSNTYTTAGGAAGDTISATATVSKVFEIKTGEEVKYASSVFLEKVSGTPDTVIVREYGSLDGINYVLVATDIIKTSNDDKYYMLSTSAACGYRYLKYQALSDGDTMKMKVTYHLKIWRE